MEPWPQQYLDRIVTTPVPHSKLTSNQYFCGSITKIFAELDPSLRGSRAENQIKFLMLVSKQTLLSPWEDILMLSDSFYCAVEQNSVTWESWSSIQSWWDRSMEALRSRNLANPAKKQKLDNGESSVSSNNASGKESGPVVVVGIPVDFLKEKNVCIKFNTGTCDHQASHKTLNGVHLLKHICGGCLKLGKGEDSSHPAKNCPAKEQFFA